MKEESEIKEEPEIKEESEIKEEPEIKEESEIKEDKQENIIRNISKYILTYIEKNKIVGVTYTYTHYFYIFFISFIFSFNNNIIHLCILLIIITLDGFVVVMLHGCPLTILEQKYLNTNSCDKRCNNLKDLKIMYKCDHEYEKTIELLINVWILIAAKCLLIIFFNTFNFKIQNYNNIYV
jgi:hypothetical protein